jgi:DNA adenine methylase
MKFPHRVPGSKGWFVAHAQRFVSGHKLGTLVEPFAGTAVVGLTLLDRGLAKQLVVAEKDPELRHLLNVVLGDSDFARRVTQFTHEMWELESEKQRDFAVRTAQRMKTKDPALSVLLRSYLAFNGILREPIVVPTLRPSRSWWPLNLGFSLKSLYDIGNKVEVLSDGFEALRRTDSADSYAFVDPPYTLGKRSPGHKLYRYSTVDHPALLRLLNHWSGSWQYTMEFCPKILRCVRDINFQPALLPAYAIPMQTMNGTKKMELVLSRQAKDSVIVPTLPKAGNSEPIYTIHR